MSLSNPFEIQNRQDNNLRPYSVGFRERDNSIATIVLYKAAPAITSLPTKTVNYLESGSKESVDSIEPRLDADTTREVTQLIPGQVPILNNNNRGMYYGIFNNFSLLEVMEAKDPIIKLHQNFGSSWNLFFFGDSPSVYTFRGIFLDTWEYPYYQEFMMMYDRFLAGKKCVENGYKMKLVYDSKIVGGYIMNIKTVLSGDTPHSKTFSFTVIITDEGYLRDNAVVKNKEFTGESGFNQLNNGHRVIDQYPSIVHESTELTTEANSNKSTSTNLRAVQEQNRQAPIV
jgi:hypothetical protein